jgi:O-antigen/teichoic acid export membrane protein
VLAGAQVAGAVVGLAGGAAAAGGLAVVLLARATARSPRRAYPPMLHRATSWTAVTVPLAVGRTTLLAIDMWLVKAMIDDPAAAGTYAAAYTLSRLPHFVSQGLASAVFPRVSGLLAEGRAAAARAVAVQAMRVVLIVFVPLCFVVAGSAEPIIVLLFSRRFAAAATPLVVLMAALSCSAALMLLSELLAAADRPGVRTAVVVALVPVSAALNVVLIARYGFNGAAAASLATFALGLLAAAAAVWVHLRAAPPLITALRCAAAGALVYLAGRFWPAAGWAVVAKAALQVLGCLALLAACGELRRADVRSVLGVARRRGRGGTNTGARGA